MINNIKLIIDLKIFICILKKSSDDVVYKVLWNKKYPLTAQLLW